MRKLNTSNATANSIAQLTSGMYICPAAAAEVWLILMRGRKPSCTACCTTEKAPEITA